MLQSIDVTASVAAPAAAKSGTGSGAGFDDEAAFLDYLFDDVWDILAQGVRVPFAAAHTPTLATIRDGHPTVRTVVLRDVSRAASMIFVHADRRSSKVQELLAQPSCSLHIFDAGRRVQLRIEAQASIHVDDDIADRQWALLQSRLRVRQRRLQVAGCGDAASVEIGIDEVDGMAEPERRPQFAAIALHVSAVEWQQVRAGGMRHARFEIGETAQRCWLDA